jgi:hypothetical protein
MKYFFNDKRKPFFRFKKIMPRDRYYDFKNILAEKIGEKISAFAEIAYSFCKNLIIKMVFEKNANFFDKIWHKLEIITSTPVFQRHKFR